MAHARVFSAGTSIAGRSRLQIAILTAVSVSFAAGEASHAVVINTATGTGNTSAPPDDPGWANVGVLGVGTGVYLGNGWVLTAAHVGGGSIVLNGGTYAMLVGSGTTLTNNGAPGKSANTDLFMFQLTSTPPGLPDVSISATSLASNAATTMIGSGRDRGAFTQWSVNTAVTPWAWTEVSSGGNFAGYTTVSSRTMRWGTNNVSASGVWIDDGFGDIYSLATVFTDSGSPSSEAQAAYGDSGGAIFHKNGSAWELSGMILTVAGYSGQPDPGANAVYGNATYGADLSFYRSQIMVIVPEPSVGIYGVAGTLIALFALRRTGRRAISGARPARPAGSF